ncbi:enamine deaminase RidA (YjgF/YER057c/UK114 family) [Microbacterium sp. AK009]|uniref:RidA family protein n=1 Tax=Microbacterium sp. AK009 TaxID=2723068 RepID=UPI0015C78E01|nr:RidA family protein [Microbacterium sp. AK009]NYF15476.1 enamine deaminase RidA (YjgF/YER057c/UK114 family) [Microbacterium sp. AK009]
MTVTLSNPGDLLATDAYHHVAVATGSRHVHVAGQVGWDAQGELAAPDLAGQVAQAYRNVATALAGVGASFADVVRLTVYVVDWDVAQYPGFADGVARVADEIGFTAPPASLIGVAALFAPGILVEVEATAVLD